MKKGLLIVISGPSGVGKGTVIKKLMKDKNLNLIYSISMTTRKPRENEIDGINYFFVSHDEFENAIKNNQLLEYARFVDNMYGTPISYVEKMINEGKNVILEIETQGAMQVIEKRKDALSIFIAPPTINSLFSRLNKRNTENKDVILKRIETAKKELLLKDKYKYTVVNATITRCVREIKEIILKNMED